MYSGTTLTNYSGRILGAHQKVDRISRKHLSALLKDDSVFPALDNILHFEGNNGPDGIKRKSPAKDEPWHFYSPFDDDDSQLIELITEHYKRLVKELKRNNKERVAFEAAWLAHSLVDGLTPAHHYPYEEKVLELRGGKKIKKNANWTQKVLMPGDTRYQRVANNWKMWGPKGLFSTHGFFELGVAMIMMPLSFDDSAITQNDLDELEKLGINTIFKNTAREIASLNMYETYYKKGWTPRLGFNIRKVLGPALIRTVTLAWYSALVDAGIISR